MKEYSRRKNIRLKDYDYSAYGSYFITICTKDRQPLFGKIQNGVMHCNRLGIIAMEEIDVTNTLRKKEGITIPNFLVMPNHVHFIVEITCNDVGTQRAVSGATSKHHGFSKLTERSVPTIVRSYKSAVTRRIHESEVAEHGILCHYDVWQSRYYEHIIRNQGDHDMIVRYISENPSRWQEDRFRSC